MFSEDKRPNNTIDKPPKGDPILVALFWSVWKAELKETDIFFKIKCS